MNDAAHVSETIRDYYAHVLQSRRDLKTSACCTAESLPAPLRETVRQLHPEVTGRFYGCGSPIPPALTGLTLLDLGCGSGRDCYLLSKLAGPRGRVIGVDMTAEQLAVARRHRDYHAQAFGYARSNVEFHEGYIEDLRALGIENDSVDAVISNCVINLSPDKPRVFREIFRVLKPGGELYFSDVFAGRRVPAELARDPVLLGECLGGALYIEDFRRLLQAAGCADARVCARTRLRLDNDDIERRAGMIDFHSLTLRAFKLPLEDRCEDYGQVAQYLGTLPQHPHAFALDDHHLFETGRPRPVCGNTADMLSATRYAPHFRVSGNKSRHFGLFNCDPVSAADASGSGARGLGCC